MAIFKTLLAALFTVFFAFCTAQQKVNYYPFFINELWGIADANKNEVYAPAIKDINFLDDDLPFIFLQGLEGKNYVFNTVSGQKTEVEGVADVSALIKLGANENFILLSGKNESNLYNPVTEETLNLGFKCNWCYNLDMKGADKKMHNYLVCNTGKKSFTILGVTKKKFSKVIAGSYDEVLPVMINDKKIGVVIGEGKKYLLYDASLKLKATFNFKSAKGSDMSDEIDRELVKIYKTKEVTCSNTVIMEIDADGTGNINIKESPEAITISRSVGEDGSETLINYRGKNLKWVNWEKYKNLPVITIADSKEYSKKYFSVVVKRVNKTNESKKTGNEYDAGDYELIIPDKYLKGLK
jgi:hypothetical protein